MKKKGKLSDHVRKGIFSGEPRKILDVYSEVDSIEVMVTPSKMNDNSTGLPSTKPRIYRNNRVGDVIDCENPLCNGGFFINKEVSDMIKDRVTSKTITKICNGTETSLNRPCVNNWTAKIDIKYK